MAWIDPLQKMLRIKRELPATSLRAPVFLTGCMRSGTTFFANLLGEHPQLLHLEGELNRPWTVLGGLDCQVNRAAADRRAVTPEAAAQMAAYFERCYGEFARKRYYLWRLIHRFKKGSGGLVKDHSKIRLLQKSVHLVNRVDYLLHLFAGAKIILIIRPIEAQVSSLRSHFLKGEREGRFMQKPRRAGDSWISVDQVAQKDWDVQALAETWIHLNYRALQDLDTNAAERYMVIDYRQLVEQPQQVCGAVYRFLGLGPFHNKVSHSLKDRSVFNSHSGGNPLTDWQTRLGPEDRAAIDAARDQYRDEYHYIQDYLAKASIV